MADASKLKLPHRAEHIGSLLRPRELRDAFKAHAAGQMSDAAYREVEDRNILEAIRMQEEAGLATISDGEFRRGSWAFGLVKAVEGFGEARSMFEFHDAAGNSYPFDHLLRSRENPPQPPDRGRRVRVRPPPHPARAEGDDAGAELHAFFPRQGLRRPGRLSRRRRRSGPTCCASTMKSLPSLGRAGAQYLQIDEVPLAMLCDPAVRERAREIGEDPDALVTMYIDAVNDVLSARPAGNDGRDASVPRQPAIAMAGRGKLRGGGRAPVQRNQRRRFLSRIRHAARGRFRAAALHGEGQDRGAGPRQHQDARCSRTPTRLRRRIDEAARHVPLERLALSPQCGFASTVGGNLLSIDDERRKLGAGRRSRKARLGLEKKRETSKPEGETLMAYENFVVERAGAIATVYFNRPEKLNPISGKLLTEMLEVAAEFRDDEESRVVILTGKGRSFCAGADIGGLTANAGAQAQRAQTDAGRLRAARTGWRLMEEWERLDQVTIAAVNGFAIGGGLSLAMACDFRIAAAGARIWIPEVALGVPYMWGSVTRLINLVGMSKAKEMIMTCDEVSAEEALKIGLVNQVVPAERLTAAALEFAGKLVSKPPMALRRTKDFFKALGNGRLGDITYADGYLGLSCLASDDMSEAMAAFKEKRPGRYRGR